VNGFATAIMKRLLHKNIKVKRGAHGLGLFATGPVKKSAVVAEYWGKIITEEEANRVAGKYLFELGKQKAIDGKGRKNVARYINHSCSPNCEPQEQKKQRIFIVAKRDIIAGEEFGYNYGKEYWEEHIKPLGCRCGCRGKGPKRWR
jgi:SET domain-containing protein